MSKLRSLNTAFWSDTWVEELTPNEKLLFIYLVTNEKTNMLGIYEASIKKISFETGLDIETVSNALKGFERVSKVKYIDNYIILINYMKHQNYNTNMKKSAIDIYNNLPKCLKNNSLVVSKDNPLKGFESLLNHYGMVRKVEVEYEVEDEIEIQDEVEYNFDITKLLDIKDLQKHYLSDERLTTAIINNDKNNLNSKTLPLRLKEFTEHLESQGRYKETFEEYAKYFLNWAKIYKDKNLSYEESKKQMEKIRL